MKTLICYIGPLFIAMGLLISLAFIAAPDMKTEPVVEEPIPISLVVALTMEDDLPLRESSLYIGEQIGETSELYFKINEDISFQDTSPSVLSVACGEGTIEIDYDTGEVSFLNGCDPSKASKALWKGIKPFFNMEVRR